MTHQGRLLGNTGVQVNNHGVGGGRIKASWYVHLSGCFLERLKNLSTDFYSFLGHYFKKGHILEGEINSWQINTKKLFRYFFLFWFHRKEPKGNA